MSPTMPRIDVPQDTSDDFDASACEARLVESARGGSEDAFAELVHRYQRRVQRVIGRFVSEDETVADLTQETFLRAFVRLSQFDPSRRFGPWLFQIGVNLTLDHLRQKKRRIWWSLFSQTGQDRTPDPEMADPRVKIDLQQEVQAVLEQIPEKYRTVLVLRDLENFSTSEIAAVLARTEATIRWRLSEARQRFAVLWAKRSALAGTTLPGMADDTVSSGKDALGDETEVE
ncbi:MAG: RNA polymerase subunit sigma [Planctomyces sp.]|nr:RNA polymerase subunit sigma [Planctomyces sp.]